MHAWAAHVTNALVSLFVLQDKENETIDIAKINDDSVFVPVLPLFENYKKESEDAKSGYNTNNGYAFLIFLSCLLLFFLSFLSSEFFLTHSESAVVLEAQSCALSKKDTALFLEDQYKTLLAKLKDLESIFPKVRQFVV
jgi:hypothetical protein